MVEGQPSNHRNQVSGPVTGPVVQAGTIQQVTVVSRRVPAGADWVVPRQLPLTVRDFTGRVEYLAALDGLLPNAEVGEGSDSAGAVVISAVDGAGGIGKTTLAVYWAHRVQHRFPDGTLHTNLRGYGPGEPATPGAVLDGFLRALGVPAERMPGGVEAQGALFRSLLAGRQVLIVLDNANSADQVRPLLPGSPGCVVVVTSRDRLTGLVVTEGATRLTLDLLTEQEAVELVSSILGPHQADTDAVNELVRRCARLPLALRIAATRAVQPSMTVEEVVAELADESGPLEALSQGGDERAAVRTVFDWSYRRLDDDHARLFRLLSLHPGPDFSAHVAAAVVALELRGARRLLEDLTSAHLLEPSTPGRYRFHDLLRSYAAELVERDESVIERDRACRALTGWYAHTSHICDTVAYPAHTRWRHWHLALPAHSPAVTDRRAARQWLETERGNLLAVIRTAVHRELCEYALYLAESMRFLYWVGSVDELLEADSIGLIAARRLGHLDAETYFQSRCGEALIYLRRWDEAFAELSRSLALARRSGSRHGQAYALSQLGLLLVQQERFHEALTYLQEALPVTRGVDGGRWEGLVEGLLGCVYIGLGEHQQALEHSERQLALRRKANDLPSEPYALHQVAQARQALGDHGATITLCREAIRLGRRAGDVLVTAQPLDTLAISLHGTGKVAEALVCWRDAAVICDNYGRAGEAARIREKIREASLPA